MIKVMVVIYGLVMFVPTVETVDGIQRTELAAIFVKSHGSETAKHTSKLHKLTDEGLVQVPLPSTDFQIRIENGTTESVDLSARDTFADLSPLFSSPDDARTRRDCVDPSQDCSDHSGKDLTHGWVTIQGKWVIKPATYCCGLRLPLGNHDWARFSFHDPANTDLPKTGKPLATALILEALANKDDLKVLLGTSEVPLAVIDDPGVCRRWTGSDTPCAILLIGNTTEDHRGCPNGNCRFDRHFARLFHLSQGPPQSHPAKLPYVTSAPLCPQPDELRDEACLDRIVAAVESQNNEGRNMPSVRCPPAFADGPDT